MTHMDPLVKQSEKQIHQKNKEICNTRSVSRRSETAAGSLRRRPNSARAAVLICCLFEGGGEDGGNGDLRVLLTKRASTLSSHPGEVSLPGRKREEGDDDDVATALREAKEEIGLDPSLVEVVTVVQPYATKIGIMVVPVVGIFLDKNAYHPPPNPAEVEVIFDAPLEMFLQDENRSAEQKEWMGEKYLLHRFDCQTADKNYVVFALTAGILIRVASVVYPRPPAFTKLCPKFWHSWGVLFCCTITNNLNTVPILTFRE